MSLKALYEKFLARPDSGLLSTDVALHYITTTTSFNGRDAVANHLTKQDGIAKKKSEKILSTVEGPTSLCLDVELTLEFVVGGGAYLLTLDENFIVDRVVTFPLVGDILQLRPYSIEILADDMAALYRFTSFNLTMTTEYPRLDSTGTRGHSSSRSRSLLARVVATGPSVTERSRRA